MFADVLAMFDCCLALDRLAFLVSSSPESSLFVSLLPVSSLSALSSPVLSPPAPSSPVLPSPVSLSPALSSLAVGVHVTLSWVKPDPLAGLTFSMTAPNS